MKTERYVYTIKLDYLNCSHCKAEVKQAICKSTLVKEVLKKVKVDINGHIVIVVTTTGLNAYEDAFKMILHPIGFRVQSVDFKIS